MYLIEGSDATFVLNRVVRCNYFTQKMGEMQVVYSIEGGNATIALNRGMRFNYFTQ